MAEQAAFSALETIKSEEPPENIKVYQIASYYKKSLKLIQRIRNDFRLHFNVPQNPKTQHALTPILQMKNLLIKLYEFNTLNSVL